MGNFDLELARNTWNYGRGEGTEKIKRGNFCWYQGGIFTACLGLTEETKELALGRFLHPHYKLPEPDWQKEGLWMPYTKEWLKPGWKVPRYPAFWDTTGFDARPDMDHGGAGMIQLQEMLMQTVDDRILLLPAWPADWDVDFKLHAPGQTIVEARVRGGKIIDLKVTPELRRKDIEVSVPFKIEKAHLAADDRAVYRVESDLHSSVRR